LAENSDLTKFQNAPLSTGVSKQQLTIGLFDSGVGGLSVLSRLAACAVPARYIYFADTGRCPYGNRDAAEIGQFVEEIVGFLSDFKIDALVMACNTSAALARGHAEAAVGSSVKLYDLIAPTCKSLSRSRFSSIGVMATFGTVNSQAFSKGLRGFGYEGDIREVACPRLVPIIESGKLPEHNAMCDLEGALREYLTKLAGMEAIVLGCTHFPFVAPQIERLISEDAQMAKLFPAGLTLIDPATCLVDDIFPGLNEMAKSQPVDLSLPAFKYFTTGTVRDFERTAVSCVGRIGGCREVSIADISNYHLKPLDRFSAFSVVL